MKSQSTKKLRVKLLGVYFLLKTLLPLFFTILLVIVLFKSNEIKKRKVEDATAILVKYQEDMTAHFDSINHSIDLIIANLEQFKRDIGGSTDEMEQYLGQSKEEVQAMLSGLEGDVKKIKAQGQAELKHFKDAFLGDINKIKEDLKSNFNHYGQSIQAVKKDIDHIIKNLTAYKDQLGDFLGVIGDVINGIGDAIDWLLPFDIELPSIPDFPSLNIPSLNIGSAVQRVKDDINAFKSVVQDTYEDKVDGVKKLAQLQKNNIVRYGNQYKAKMDSIANNMPDLNYHFLQISYWDKGFIEPGRNIYGQVNEMASTTFVAYDQINDMVLSNTMYDDEFRDYLKGYKNNIKCLIYLALLLGVVYFIGYLLRFQRNIRIAIQLLRGEELEGLLF